MKQRAEWRKFVSMVLLMILCLMGIYGTTTTDVPAYTSFSCAENWYQNKPQSACQTINPKTKYIDTWGLEYVICLKPDQSVSSLQDTITIAVERFYQDSLVKLPDAEQATERMEQTQSASLLERCRPERRSSRAVAESPESGAGGISRQIAGISRYADGAETASFSYQIRIISYIHAQDGQKDYTI